MGNFVGIPENVIDNMLIEMDTNNDGEISLDEWLNYVMNCKESEKNGIKCS